MIAITNDGSQSVDIQVAIRGYFITRSTVDVAGDTYVPFNDPSRLCVNAHPKQQRPRIENSNTWSLV